MPKKKYDCLKCPGYCCSYPIIEVKDRYAKQIAKHFGLTLKEAEKKFFRKDKDHGRVMARKEDQHFGKICTFFDTDKRRCTIYEVRPFTCRDFPGDDNCGYWDFLAFERIAQKDRKWVSTTDHSED
jgi:uncharacterized protein